MNEYPSHVKHCLLAAISQITARKDEFVKQARQGLFPQQEDQPGPPYLLSRRGRSQHDAVRAAEILFPVSQKHLGASFLLRDVPATLQTFRGCNAGGFR